jgi:hypothetical protein
LSNKFVFSGGIAMRYLRPPVIEGPAPNGNTIFVLMVFEAGGVYTSTAATEERSFKDLAEYVRKNWQGNHYRNVPLPMRFGDPSDRKSAAWLDG